MTTATARATRAAVPVLSVFVAGKPVSVNRQYGQRRTGGRYLTPAAKAWIQSVWVETLMERHLTGWAAPTPRRNLQVTCTFYGVRGDADNYLKATLDGLKIGLTVDDRYFSPVTAMKMAKGYAGQGCLIEVWDREQEVLN